MKIKTIAWLISLLAQVNSLQIVNDNLVLQLEVTENGAIQLNLTLDGAEKITGVIGQGATVAVPSSCEGSKCRLVSPDVTLTIDSIDSGFEVIWESNNVELVFRDCLDLNVGKVNWFGGPEKWQADWPVETSLHVNRLYTTIKSDNGAVSERYWLNSKGGFIFLVDKVPLFLDQNNLKAGTICFIGSLADPYLGRDEVILKYSLVAKDDPKIAHLHAVNNFLGKPTGHPAEWMIRHPVWTTWANFYKDINDKVVLDFAKEIASHGFAGQIEIDDYWERCYGSLAFNNVQFPEINDTVKSLHDLNFTVTLWTHPFVNDDCEDFSSYGKTQGYFVKSVGGSDETSWWDGNSAHYIDFTNEDAKKWFIDRLKLLQELHGIDSFKFDAGESDYAPVDPSLQGDVELSPNSFTSSYVRSAATFGTSIEVRSAWRTQDLPVFLRMLDKDSRWTINNGLLSLITSLLQLNMSGYTLILPDMIGGNGYQEKPTPELIARWTQANTFMPAMQFSYLPWQYPSPNFNSSEIVKKYVALHEEYTDEILIAMNNSIVNGTPVNPPIWWVDPTDEKAFAINDQYLLGEKILVAPVVVNGAVARSVYLPAGTWKDGNNGTLYEGPTTINQYPAPIDILPYFIKV